MEMLGLFVGRGSRHNLDAMIGRLKIKDPPNDMIFRNNVPNKTACLI